MNSLHASRLELQKSRTNTSLISHTVYLPTHVHHAFEIDVNVTGHVMC